MWENDIGCNLRIFFFLFLTFIVICYKKNDFFCEFFLFFWKTYCNLSKNELEYSTVYTKSAEERFHK